MEKRTIKRKHILIIVSILFAQFILAIFIAAFISNYSLTKQVVNDEIKRRALYNQILDGASTAPVEVTVSYDDPISTGSPLVFGGSHSPELEHQDAWDKIDEIRVTSVRKDFFPENALPQNITLEAYKLNINGIQDPANWNQESLNEINGIYKNAKQRGIKTVGIVAYAPKWLTHSNTIYGVPKDWVAYKDIVKKTYAIYRDNLDYVEIWNEPSLPFFLNLDNSNLSREEAYKMIFKYASEAIREVDQEKNDGKKMLIGGPTSHSPFETSVLESILEDPELAKQLDFVSYHAYDMQYVNRSPYEEFKKVLKKYDKDNLPRFITEWNYDPSWDNPNPYNDTDLAITYTGNKFVDFLKEGIAGTNYFTLDPINKNRSGSYGFYTWETDHAELLPQAKTWRILSKDMKLGKGESKIFEPQTEYKSINSLGFINIDKEPGAVIVNSSKTPYVANIKFDKLPIRNYADVEVFYASKNNDAQSPEYKSILKIKNGTTDFTYFVPAETIMAVRLTEKKDWFDLLIHN